MAQSLLTLMLVSLSAFMPTSWHNITGTMAADNERTINHPTIDLSNATACDFVYGFDIQALFETEGDVVGEELIKVERLSTCAYHWFNQMTGKEESLELWLEVDAEGDDTESFTEDLQKTLEKGELRHPMKPQEGRIAFELIEGPGDMTIWSPEARALRWHFSDNYYFIINLDEKVSPRSADEDLQKLITLANFVNKRMGLN